MTANSSVPRIVWITALISAIAGIVLLGARSYFAISFLEPLQSQTRGAEFESLFAIWKFIYGHTLYNDQTEIPFSGTFYNWLFYASYGQVTEFFLNILSLSDAWLPTITRLITLAGAVLGAGFCYYSFTKILNISETGLRLLTAAFVIFLFFGPLIGFWAIATGPDIWPIAILAVGTHIFIRHYDKYPLRVIMIICVLSYFTWAFKQNFMHLPASVGLYLLIRKDWKEAAILTAVMVSAGLITLAVGGGGYVKMLYLGDTKLFFSLDQVVLNFEDLARKTTPLLVFIAAIILLPASRKISANMFKERGTILVPFLGVPIACIQSFSSSFVFATTDNEFFMLSYYVVFSALIIIKWHAEADNFSAAFWRFLVFGWLANLAAVGTVLAGQAGVISVRPLHDARMAVTKCLTGLSDNVFAEDSHLMLPWMVPAKDPFVLHFSYISDRVQGIKAESGGIGGLIDKGKFDVLALHTLIDGRYDGSDLRQYQKQSQRCAGWDIYYRKNYQPGSG